MEVIAFDAKAWEASRQIIPGIKYSPKQQVTTYEKQGTTFEKQGTTYEKQGTTYDKQGTTFDKQGTTFDKQGTTFDKQRITFDHVRGLPNYKKTRMVGRELQSSIMGRAEVLTSKGV